MLTRQRVTEPRSRSLGRCPAAGLSEPELLLYRSNLLGADKRITNYGGGNTSLKIIETDPLTRQPVEVLWVKGSGGDLGSITLDGFATLYMDKLNAMKSLYRGVAHEDEMVGFSRTATFNLNPRAASIDTPLHAFLPYPHVDHVHPDAVIAIAASKNAASSPRIYGDEIGWLPWKRPGFELGLWLEKFARENPEAKGCVLESHGLFTWASDGKACYELTLDVINRAIAWFEGEIGGKAAFGGEAVKPLPATERARASPPRLMPAIRSLIGKTSRRSAISTIPTRCWNSSAPSGSTSSAALGTSCPDHFLRTKIWPLVLASIRTVEMDAAVLQASSKTTARAMPAITSAQSMRIRRRCATPTRSSI